MTAKYQFSPQFNLLCFGNYISTFQISDDCGTQFAGDSHDIPHILRCSEKRVHHRNGYQSACFVTHVQYDYWHNYRR